MSYKFFYLTVSCQRIKMSYFLSTQYNVSRNPNFPWHSGETLYVCVFCHWISEAAALSGENCWLFNVCLETPLHCSFSNVSKGSTGDVLEGLCFQQWLTGKKTFYHSNCVPEKKTQVSHQLHCMESVDCGQWRGTTEPLSPRWTHFNYRNGNLPTGFHSVSAVSPWWQNGRTCHQQWGTAKLPGKHQQSQVNAFPATLAPKSCQGNTCSPVSLSWERANEPGSQRPLADRDGVSLW